MIVRWVVRTTLGVLLLGLPLAVGCGGGSDNGPAEEPNVGPGGPPGGLQGTTSTKPAKTAPGK